MNACGETMAMMLGHNWVPIPSNGSGMNVGTIPAPPTFLLHPAAEILGWTRGLLIGSGWGGELVVVRGRESRPHGEGVQCDCRIWKQ